jgi:plasmid stability protein
MRTTVDIPDETYRELKIKAAREGKPLRQIVLRGIQRELEAEGERSVRKLKLPLIPSSRPGTLELTNEQIDELTAFS